MHVPALPHREVGGGMGEGRGGYIDLSTSTIPWPWVYYRTAKVSMSPVVRLKSIDGRMHEILSLGWVHSNEGALEVFV